MKLEFYNFVSKKFVKLKWEHILTSFSPFYIFRFFFLNSCPKLVGTPGSVSDKTHRSADHFFSFKYFSVAFWTTIWVSLFTFDDPSFHNRSSKYIIVDFEHIGDGWIAASEILTKNVLKVRNVGEKNSQASTKKGRLTRGDFDFCPSTDHRGQTCSWWLLCLWAWFLLWSQIRKSSKTRNKFPRQDLKRSIWAINFRCQRQKYFWGWFSNLRSKL